MTRPTASTIAPGLRGVYAYADRAHSAITLTGDIAAAHQAARDARTILIGAAIDVEAMERWLGTHDGVISIDEYFRRLQVDLDEAVEALASAIATGN
ncbi:MAG: hypothetical protein U5K73_04660 [Halofilum sp. (in: g-proteobacteria)]|nr:hypothetical protein [Halofilum sp. (in: g-proteobacteria)]